MKLATIGSDQPRNRDGQLIVVSHDNRFAVRPDPTVAVSLREALENWETAEPLLQSLYNELNEGHVNSAFELRWEDCLAPLPRTPGFYDGSAFLSHVERARGSRGDTVPDSARITPLMYQGVGDNLLAFDDPIELGDPAFGGDFEGEFGVVTVDVPRGVRSEQAEVYVALLTMLNDITLREIVKIEIQTKFGFLQGKPNSSFAPLMVTPDELGEDWQEGRIHLELQVFLNGQLFGRPNGREMHFSFFDLIAHACRTRALSAGSIIGSGTISNEDKNRGFATLTEKRYQEILDTGQAETGWLQEGDRIQMDCEREGLSIFGPIDQKVVV